MTLLVLVIGGIFVATLGFVVLFGAPYVPSLRREVHRAFSQLYPLDGSDYVVDLGSGDGVVLLEAAKRGARCIGVELNPLFVMISRLRLGKKASIRLGNMWAFKLPAGTTLVYAFSVSRDSAKLRGFMQTEADRLGKPISLMTFGAKLPGMEADAVLNAHSLYRFSPLQRG